jgi:hypothetical protein
VRGYFDNHAMESTVPMSSWPPASRGSFRSQQADFGLRLRSRRADPAHKA